MLPKPKEKDFVVATLAASFTVSYGTVVCGCRWSLELRKINCKDVTLTVDRNERQNSTGNYSIFYVNLSEIF